MANKNVKNKGFQKCKYLDDLGLNIVSYGTNFCDNTDKRYKKWMKEREKYGFDSRETWNLDRIFVEWIYTRFKMYKEVGGEVVDLSYHKFPYTTKSGKTKELTQLQAINKVLNYCEKYLKADFIDAEFFPKNIWDLLGELMPSMWW